MKRMMMILSTVVFLFAMTQASQAQESLSLETARARALAASKTLQSALLSVNAAELEKKIQSYDMLPSISASAGTQIAYAAGAAGDPSASLGISLSQTIYNGGKTALLLAIDSISTQIAQAQARSEYLGILQAVDSAFYAALEAKASLDAAQADLDASREHLRLARAKLEAGMITKYAYLETEAETAAADTSLIQGQGALSAAESKLASLVGITGTVVPQPIDSAVYDSWMRKMAACSGEEMASFIGTILSEAIAKNPDLKIASLSVVQARKKTEAARADYLPNLSASASQSLSVEKGQGLSYASGSISLSAAIPIGFWETKSNVSAKKLTARISELSEEEVSRDLKLEIQSAVYECASSARAVLSSQKALDYAQGYYESVLELYKLSASSSSDLSDAQALVSSNRNASINASYAFLDSLAALRTLAGLDSDELLERRLHGRGV